MDRVMVGTMFGDTVMAITSESVARAEVLQLVLVDGHFEQVPAGLQRVL